MTPDLEGLSARPIPHLPQAALDCPCCTFSVGVQACKSRQVALATMPRFRGCDPECSNFDREAYEKRLKAPPVSTPAPQWDAEEECPMDEHEKKTSTAPEPVQREHKYPNAPPLEEGARIMQHGRVKRGSNFRKPCPKCNARWINEPSLSCKPCNDTPERRGAKLAMMRQAKALKHSPGPKPPPPTPPTPPTPPKVKTSRPEPPNLFPAGLVERLAQQLASEVCARAFEILGLEVVR
jgi:hypothetical protein